MCKQVVVLFKDPQSPPGIRPVLSGIGTRFISVDNKKLMEELQALKPTRVAMDGICPKIANKLLRQLPKEISFFYVGGTKQQLQALPTGLVTLDNWTLLRKNLEPTT